MANITQIKTTIGTMLRQAIKKQHQGDLSAAESICRSILSQYPENADAMQLLGVLHNQAGESNTAIQWLNRAIRRHPTNPDLYNTLGIVFKRSGDLKKAKSCYQKALTFKPDHAEALYNLAGIYHANQAFEQSLDFYNKAIAARRNFHEAWNNMAAVLNILGRYQEAVQCCEQALNFQPRYGEAYNNIANAYLSLGELQSAITSYNESIALLGESSEVLCNLANALQEIGKVDEAISNYQKAIRKDPLYGKAYNNLGTAFRFQRKLADAETQFRKAVRLIPEDVEAYHNLGNIYYDREDFQSAAKWYDRALTINPNSLQTLLNRGIVFQESGCPEKALDCFNKVLSLEPGNPKAYCHIVHEMYQCCDWSRIDELKKKIAKITQCELSMDRRPTEMPFLNLIRTSNPIDNFLVAKGWSKDLSVKSIGGKALHRFKHPPHPKNRIVVGYLSNNIRNHPTSHLINQIFSYHDRDIFHVNVYSYGKDDGSLYRKKIADDCDKFLDLSQTSNEDAAKIIFQDRVDILVDLVGYMRGNRLEICSYRPSPIQVRWLGLAGTTGADFFDYLITDPIVTPVAESSWYTENFVYMPNSYQVNSRPLKEAEKKFSRNELGLPEKGFVFCCFCSSYKIDPVMFNSWMQILKCVADSVLWLLKGNAIVERNLKREARRSGVDPDRLIFADKISKEDHLRRIVIADLALDTGAISGAATTSDALYAGVPVVSLKGTHFASRMSVSILNAIGLDELACRAMKDYEEKAVKMGNNPLIVKELKKRLIKNRKEKPLFDTQRFVKDLEVAYSKMWDRYQEGKPPGIIHVDGTP